MKKKDWLKEKNVLTGKDLEVYFKSHVMRIRGCAEFYMVTKPLRVFKQTCYPDKHYRDQRLRDKQCITALTIPVGAKIYARDYIWERSALPVDARKMRASEAIVDSNWTYRGRRLRKSKVVSGWAPSFQYQEGNTVKPTHGFDMDHQVCASGIHFFLNFADAYNYDL